MNMKKCENGLWKCVIKNLDIVFYVETQKQAIAIAYKLGGAR